MSQTQPQPEIFKNRRILAADDDPIMREMIRARLGQDVEVVCAENGEIAWEKLVAEDFDLAIIDLGMPKLDGFGLIQYLRQTPKTVDLPIIVATSRGDNEAIEKAFSSGASGFVTKPVNWSLFKYDVQFVLKSGLVERELRATKQAGDVLNRTKDNLIAVMAQKLCADISQASKNPFSDDLLLMGKILRERPPVNFVSVDVNKLIDIVNDNTRQAADAKSVKVLGRKILADIEISVDADLWSHALIRLVNRAIASSPAGGTVEIIIGGQPDGSLVFSVRDNGKAKTQTSIAAKMSKFANSSVSELEGADSTELLELPLIKRIAEIHGGKPLFQSDAASGNIAALWLPNSRVTVSELKETA